MNNDDIEIGISVKTNIRLTLPNKLGKCPFDVDKIINVKETEDGSIIKYAEAIGVSSRYEEFEYQVEDNCEKIKEAIKDALSYKEKMLEFLNSILE
jgi:hypothetical protein